MNTLVMNSLTNTHVHEHTQCPSPGMAKLSHSVEALDHLPSCVGQHGIMTSPFKTPSKILSPKTTIRTKSVLY